MKIVKLLPLIILLLIGLPGAVQAQFTFTTNYDNTITITGYTGSNDVVVIPDTTNGYPVISIGTYAFVNCTSLINVTIGTNVISIGDYAFLDDFELTSITIPNSVSSIGAATFENCSSVTNVIIGTNVTSVGSSAFANCDNLADITIPSSVVNLGDFVFDGCFELTAITVDAQNPSYSSLDGILFDKNQTTLIRYPPGNACEFYNIPIGVASIVNQAFSDCSWLANVIITTNVTSIGDQAFDDCYFLEAITVDIQNPVYSSVDGILFDKNQTTLVRCPQFKNGNFSIPSNVTRIENDAFYSCSDITSITIGSSVTEIGTNAFYFCFDLTNVIIPDNVTTIDDSAFDFCPNLASVVIGNGVTNIGNSAFASCNSLTSVSLGDNVASVGDFVFAGCSSLTNVTIGKSITNIGDGMFLYCTNLTGAYFESNAPYGGYFTFAGDDNAIVYYLPGTTGWGTTFAGRPTALWQPQIAASFGIQTNQFGFNINWASGQVVVIEACTNLTNPFWSPVQTNTLTGGSFYFSDQQWTNYPSRFYRLRSP
jgi:hypothetical protein